LIDVFYLVGIPVPLRYPIPVDLRLAMQKQSLWKNALVFLFAKFFIYL
jgi:hypothetical protein